ncbi:MAG TPA: hypothetical protein DCY88_26905 [Cyanobacteria bacterium UBA11372]|nr:hypothetical protein [Cyanobacteria bacterium UBA11372]
MFRFCTCPFTRQGINSLANSKSPLKRTPRLFAYSAQWKDEKNGTLLRAETGGRASLTRSQAQPGNEIVEALPRLRETGGRASLTRSQAQPGNEIVEALPRLSFVEALPRLYFLCVFCGSLKIFFTTQIYG